MSWQGIHMLDFRHGPVQLTRYAGPRDDLAALLLGLARNLLAEDMAAQLSAL